MIGAALHGEGLSEPQLAPYRRFADKVLDGMGEVLDLADPAFANVIAGEALDPAMEGRYSAAAAIGLLGRARSPELLLGAMHEGLQPGGRIVVAETLAHARQALRPPWRRAFTTPQILRMLEMTGFTPVFSVDRPEGVVCVVADRSDPPGARPLVAAIRAAFSGDVARAESFARQAADAGVGVVRQAAYCALGELYAARQDGDQAVQALMRSGDGGQDPRPFALLARLLVQAGDAGEAGRFAVRAFELDRLDPDAVLAMAVVSDAVGDPACGAFWQSAARLSPADPAAAAGFATWCSRAGLHDEAIRTLNALRAYGDDSGELHLMIALMLERAGRRDDALIEARLAKKLSPGHAGAAEMVRRLSN